MGVKMMLDFIEQMWGDFVFSGMTIPIICYAFASCFKLILISKVARNKYTNLIPLFCMIIGAILMILIKDFLPVFLYMKTRIYIGMVLGLSATGIHQLFKRVKRFFTMKKIEENYREVPKKNK